VRLERAGRAGFTLGVTAVELSSLIAAVRVAADMLEADDRTPPGAVAQLRALLGDYERAAARLDRPGDRPGDQFGGLAGLGAGLGALCRLRCLLTSRYRVR
jgi:hypothetical protein